MPATLDEIQTDACTSGIGKVTDPVKLLQLQTQLLADQLLVTNPAADVTPAGINSRACTSGIGNVTSIEELLVLQAQLLNDLQP